MTKEVWFSHSIPLDVRMCMCACVCGRGEMLTTADVNVLSMYSFLSDSLDCTGVDSKLLHECSQGEVEH